MNATKNRPAPSKNEQQIMTFQFSESKSEIRNVFVNNEPHFIATDIAKALGYSKPRNAINQHCRYALKQGVPHPQSKIKQLQVLVIPESDVYRLIMSSTLPSAQKFERWVMEEVLPSIRKKGYYAMNNNKYSEDFIDARDIPYNEKEVNGFNVRHITIDKVIWASVNDINKAMHSSTSASQVVKKLNAKQLLAKKIWLFGNTHPAWFTNELGLKLLISGSRKLRSANHLKLEL